jgi:hypothetical protein
MTEKKVCSVTGAGGRRHRQAALAAGHAVVATDGSREGHIGCRSARRSLAVRLDVTLPGDAKAAVAAAMDRFAGLMCW